MKTNIAKTMVKCACGDPQCKNSGPMHFYKDDSIPTTNQGIMFLSCGLCSKEKPQGISPREYASIQVAMTEKGLQVWCKRHDVNIMNIDFQGETFPATGKIK